MAVLCEAISVVIKTKAIKEKFTGGYRGFYQKIPNNTYCSDGELECIGFLSSQAVGEYVEILENNGLTFQVNNEPLDLCVVDMLRGPTMQCEWLEFHKIPFGEGKVSVAWLFEGTRIPVDGMFMTDNPLKLYTPEGWEYENSMTTKHILVVEDEALLSQYPVDEASLSEELEVVPTDKLH
jgi:hypothetical protein|tara:strand:+ start:228 stop:767 length:540 start_codon:yes stop_codon:yes gene_type:complete